MPVAVRDVIGAFEILYESLFDRGFRKTYGFHEFGERELLPLVRVFLLGWFGGVTPELQSKLAGGLTGKGRIDFLVGDVAVEFAVRRPRDRKATLSQVTNATEMKKLMQFDGRAVLILFDFSASPFNREDLTRYRDWPSLGKGNHKRSAFNAASLSEPTGPASTALHRARQAAAERLRGKLQRKAQGRVLERGSLRYLGRSPRANRALASGPTTESTRALRTAVSLRKRCA